MPEPSPLLVPQMNVNDEHAVIVAWHVDSGTRVEAEQVIATLETTKATFDVQADRAGFLIYEHEVKSLVQVGAPLAWIGDSADAQITQQDSAPAAGNTAPSAGDERFTRKALRRMRELGLSAADFPGEGRVELSDVEAAGARRGSGRASASVSTAAFAGAEPIGESASKLGEAARLSDVYRAIVPSMVTVSVSCDDVRARMQKLSSEEGAPFSLLELVIHEAAALLADYPDLNGFFASGRGWRYNSIAIGFAINAGGRGLKVPVVQSQQLGARLSVARTVRDLSLRYFRNELKMDDVIGGTFTVTDLSSYGVTHFVPVLNDRQAAILGICAERPGTGHQDLVLCFDHRMSDGMRAAEFLGALREQLR
jgi:pyruvate/2-oxoglutarate dehydrogenase complex dihydrolipoamide acyltransferase (E2) component